MKVALHDYVLAYLNFSITTRTANRGLGKKPLSILSDESVASGHVSEVGTERVCKTYTREP